MLGDPIGVNNTPRNPFAIHCVLSPRLAWSPDGTQILLQDSHQNLWTIEVASGNATKIDTDTYPDPVRQFDATWSPDSRWVSYSKNLAEPSAGDLRLLDGRQEGAPAYRWIGRFDLASLRRRRQVSLFPGEHELWAQYRLAGDEFFGSPGAPSDLSGRAQCDRAVAALTRDRRRTELPRLAKHPAPEPAPQPTPATPRTVTVRIDLNGIGQRILAVNVPAGDYSNLAAGATETFYYTEPMVTTAECWATSATVAAISTQGAHGRAVSRRHSLLHGLGRQEEVALSSQRWRGKQLGNRRDRATRAKMGDGPLNVAQLEMRVDPRAEWAQIFRETWRIQREYFYDPKMHGADWQAIYEKYWPLVAHVGHRADLGYFIAMVGGELTVGHSYLHRRG